MEHNTMSVIKPAITSSMARALLKFDIPPYISILDVDESICAASTFVAGLPPKFRKTQITRNINVVSYVKHSSSGRGKVSYRLDGDRESVRVKLQHLAGEVT